MAVRKKKSVAATGNTELKETIQDAKMTFSEREQQHHRIMARLKEAYPMVGGTSAEDVLWRNLTSHSDSRDLNPITHDRMRNISYWLWDANPMGHRIIEILSDFVVGDGFKIFAEDNEVQEVIDQFWDDPDNNIDEAQNIDVRELSLFGELCFPVWVNKIDGHVKLGYLDPERIKKVTKNTRNPRLLSQVKYSNISSPNDIKTLNIVSVDKNIKSPTYGKRVGDCLYYTINKTWSTTRGRSELLCLADWLDGHDQFLFARLERAFLLNNYIWDITCEGMTEDELKKFVKTISSPKAGSIRAHNEKITWNTISPKLESADASQEVRLFKNQILGGAGFPEHWFAEGDKTTRATAMAMGLPTLKRLKSRQKIIKLMYKNMVEFQIDQAIIAGRLKDNVNKRFIIQCDPIISRDDKNMAEAVRSYTDGLIAAQNQGWISAQEASYAFRLFLTQCGAEFDRSFKIDDIEKNKKIKIEHKKEIKYDKENKKENEIEEDE